MNKLVNSKNAVAGSNEAVLPVVPGDAAAGGRAGRRRVRPPREEEGRV
jgi:hypothetical protein